MSLLKFILNLFKSDTPEVQPVQEKRQIAEPVAEPIAAAKNQNEPQEPERQPAQEEQIAEPEVETVVEPDEQPAPKEPVKKKKRKKKPAEEETIFLFRDLIPAEMHDKVVAAEEIVPLTNITIGIIKEVNEGETLGTFMADNYMIEMTAPFSGFYTWMPLFNILDMDSIACCCYPSMEMASHYGAIPEFSLSKDPVSSEYNLFWNEVDSFCDGGLNTLFPLVWGFSIKGNKPIIYFHSDKDPVAGKGDNIKLVFSNSIHIEDDEDKTIITLKVEDKPFCMRSAFFTYRTSYAYLDTEAILAMMALNLCFVQIDYRNDDPVLLEVGNTIVSIDPVEKYQYRIKAFARQFTEILEGIGINCQKIKTPEAKKSGQCYVYLMKDLTNGSFKIGMSNNPSCREKTLQSEKPEIELICSKKYPNREIAKAIEASLHSTYSSLHIRGEWFALSEQDVKDIIETLS